MPDKETIAALTRLENHTKVLEAKQAELEGKLFTLEAKFVANNSTQKTKVEIIAQHIYDEMCRKIRPTRDIEITEFAGLMSFFDITLSKHKDDDT